MAKTSEGLPVVTMDAVHKVAAEIRARGSDAIFTELTKENPLVAGAIQRFAANTVRADERHMVISDMVSIYGLLKWQAKLEQTGENSGQVDKSVSS